MSDANHFAIDAPINPYYHNDHIDRELAIYEHNNIRKLLIKAGIQIVKVPSPSACQDGVYTANWALVRGDTCVLSRLPNARCNEEAYAERVLKALGKKVIRLPKGLKFSGQGDALPCGDLLFCGSGYRSDEAAQEFAANALGYERIQLQTIPQTNETGNTIVNKASGWPDSFFYDIDLALAIIKPPINGKKGLIAYCPTAFTKESQQKLAKLESVDKIEVCLNEAQTAFATNLVSTGKTVIMSAKAPKLVAELKRHGLEVLSPEITELVKGGGFIRCVTLTLD